ncbi:TniQ family protein [Methylorubrum populi]|uniref:TniQ family protein n=1 Tax=Methylorubrum rhodesianum TaxID=29427 RepID=UPI00190C6DE5|nr:TniQ family protein [Methylorubrum rhodesianum]MBK3406367.1 TniQ family protein [Methylorubrum rhodesianum]MBY0143139.1 TniQ family protein [Methylorubrum populi]
MASLALRVRFREEEPAYGLLARLALRHRRADLRTFARDVGLSYQDTVGGSAASAIAELAGFEPGLVRSWTPTPDWHARHFRGEKFHNNDWFVHAERRVCVACLRDDVIQHGAAAAHHACCHRRCWWDLRAIDVCPRHSAWLVDRCPSCGRPLTLLPADVRFCECGWDLARVEPEQVDPLEARADAYILGRLLGRPHRAIPLLDAMPLGQATALMFSLGWQVENNRYRAGRDRHADRASSGPRPEITKGTLWKRGASREAKLAAKMDSFRILRRWPWAYQRFLDDLFRRAKDNLGSSARRDDGSSRAYRLFGHRLDGWDLPGAQPLREEYERHFLANVPAGPKTLIFGRPAEASRWVNLTYTNETCGLAPWSGELYPILCDLGIVGPGKVNHTRVKLPRSLLPTVKEMYDDALTRTQAAQLLGISMNGVSTLQAAGYLTIRDNPHDKSSYRYSRVEIEYLLFDIAGSAPVVAAADTIDLIDAAAATQFTDGHGFLGLERLLQALTRRTVPVAGLRDRGQGLSRILLRRSDVEGLMAQGRPAQAPTRDQVCKLLGIGSATFQFLVREGILKTSGSDRRSRRATFESVESFQREYISAVKIGQMLDLHFIAVFHLMRRRGYKPAFDPDTARGRIYRRTDALKAFLKKQPTRGVQPVAL